MSFFAKIKGIVAAATGLAILGACTIPPGSDVRFLERVSLVDEDEVAAKNILQRRGFSPTSNDWYSEDGSRPVIGLQGRPFIGLQVIENEAPDHVMTCFEKEYWGGIRLICFTSNEGRITWADAGWFGASL